MKLKKTLTTAIIVTLLSTLASCQADPRSDVNKDGIVDFWDLIAVSRNVGCNIADPDCKRYDVNGDNTVDDADVNAILADYGKIVIPPPQCSLDSVTVTPICVTCETGNWIRIEATYSGDCPTPVLIQVNAQSNDSVCQIKHTGGDMQGMDITCTSSPCMQVWTIPDIPSDCANKNVSVSAGQLWENAIDTGVMHSSQATSGSFTLGSLSTTTTTTSVPSSTTTTTLGSTTSTTSTTTTTPATTTVPNTPPEILNVTDNPDPVEYGSSLTYTVWWTDDQNDPVNIYVCDDACNACYPGYAYNSQYCLAYTNTWYSYSPTVVSINTSAWNAYQNEYSKNYWAIACDDNDECSSPYYGGTITINHRPTITVTEPDGIGDQAYYSYLVEYVADDQDKNWGYQDVYVSCYADNDSSGYEIDPNQICFEYSTSMASDICNIAGWSDGAYYIWCEVWDGVVAVRNYSSGPLNITHAPRMNVTQPDGVNDVADTSYNITWSAYDVYYNPITISCYADMDNSGFDKTYTCFEDVANDGSRRCNTFSWPDQWGVKNDYWIWCEAETAFGVSRSYGTGPLEIRHEANLTVIEPDGVNDVANTQYLIQWNAIDNVGRTIYISCYGDTGNTSYDESRACFINIENTGSRLCNINFWPDGLYWIWCKADNGVVPAKKYSNGQLNHTKSSIPSASSVIDQPDVAQYGENISYTVAWSDPDGEPVKVFICPDANCNQCNSTQQVNCLGSILNWTYASPAIVSVNTSQNSMYNQSMGYEKNYWAMVCDQVYGYCSTPIAGGTVKVNHKPSIKVESPCSGVDYSDLGYTIGWQVSDGDLSEQDYNVSCYADSDNSGFNAVYTCFENYDTTVPAGNKTCNTTSWTVGGYWIWCEVTDSLASARNYSCNALNVTHSPLLDVVEPDGVGDSADTQYVVKWNATDLAGRNLNVSCYGDSTGTGYKINYTCFIDIAHNPPYNNPGQYICSTTSWTAGDYWIWCQAKNNLDQSRDYSPGTLSVGHWTNTPPAVNTVEDVPDPVNFGENLTYRITWSDTEGDSVKAYICPTADCGNCNTTSYDNNTCLGKSETWAATSPAEVKVTVSGGKYNHDTLQYWVMLCDNNIFPKCSMPAGPYTDHINLIPTEYFYNFNSNEQGWTHYSDSRGCSGNNGGDDWGRKTSSVHGMDVEEYPVAFSSPVFGTDGNGNLGDECEHSYLMSPPINLNTATTASIKFDSWNYNEPGCDPSGASIYDTEYVEVSTNGGSTWSRISGCPQSGLHNENDRTWRTFSYNLNSFVGKTVYVRFRLNTGDDCCWPNDGWYVDNVNISLTL